MNTDFRTSTDAAAIEAPGAAERDDHSLQAYISDMLALERHIGVPLARQARFEQATAYGNAMTLIGRIKAANDSHVAALERQLEAAGGDGASSIKSAWGSLVGVGAAAIDSMRKTRISKSLRDDYTALGLAAIGYTMLDATALGLGDMQASALARQHLADYAPIIMDIGTEMPDIVLQELADSGVRIDPSAATAARKDAQDAWRNGSSRTHA